MSEPELAYMTGANDDFDLPRWQTQAHHDLLSSSAQAAQAAANNSSASSSYTYPGAPPLPPPGSSTHSTAAQHRMQPLHQTHTGSGARQAQAGRVGQLVDQDGHLPPSSLPYLAPAQNQLSRSASLGNQPASARVRRLHMQDDLEGAFSAPSPTSPPTHHRQNSSTANPAASFYPSSVAYQAPPFPTAAPTDAAAAGTAGQSPAGPPQADPAYGDLYFSPTSGHAPKRSHTHHEPSSAAASARAARSPLRSGPSQSAGGLLDPYAHAQSQYSPTTAAYSYHAPPYPPATHSHSRTHSQIKHEPLTPPVPSPYTPQSASIAHQPPPPPPVYSPSYPMDVSSSPHPSSTTLLSSGASTRQGSASTPNTPLPFPQPSHSPAAGGPYYPHDPMPMAVDPPAKRRASGFRRIRDQRDLRPHVNQRPAGRRVDASGAFLSVRAMLVFFRLPMR